MKIQVVLIAVLLVLVALVFPVCAFSGSGAGTSGDPYQITTTSQWMEIANANSKNYTLMNDLNFLGVNYPVINLTSSASINGQYYTISNVYQTKADYNTGGGSTYGSGLITSQSGRTTIKNLHVDNISVLYVSSSSNRAYGGIVGLDVGGGTYTNLLVTNSIIGDSSTNGGSNKNYGGITGQERSASGYYNYTMVENTKIYSSGNGMGGILGIHVSHNPALYSNNFASCTFTGSSTYVGGTTNDYTAAFTVPDSNYYNNQTFGLYTNPNEVPINTTQQEIKETFSAWDSSLFQIVNGYPILNQFAPPPVASFTKSGTGGASPYTVVFTDTSTNTPTSWYWVFGDGDATNRTVQSPVHTFTGAGTYNVNLTATNGGGSDTTATQSITVGLAPVSSFTKDKTSGTSPLTVVFTDTSTGTPTSWYWVFGDGDATNRTVQSPVHTFTGVGTYNVNLTSTNAYGSNQTPSTQSITVGDAPVASFTKSATSGSTPFTVVFTDTSTNTPTSWYWVFGDGDTTNRTVQNPVHTFTVDGTYSVNVTSINAYGSSTSAAQDITAGTVASASFTKSKIYDVVGQSVVFTDTSTGSPTSWKWVITNSTVTTTLQNPTITFNIAGIYGVNLTVANGLGGDTSAIQAVYVGYIGNNAWSWFPYSPQLVHKSFTFSIAGGQTATVPYTAYWRTIAPNGTTLYNVSNPFAGDVAGTWQLGMMIINDYGVFTSPTYPYVYYDNLTPSFTKTSSLGMSPLLVDFAAHDGAGSKATSWKWVASDGQTSTLSSPALTFTGAGVYNINLTTWNSTYSITNTTATQSITVYDDLAPSFTKSVASGNAPLSVDFTGSQGATKADTWLYVSTNDTWTSTSQSPTHIFGARGVYGVNLTITNTTYSLTKTTAIQAITVIFDADFTGTPLTGVEPKNVVFTDTSTGAPTSWTWVFGDGQYSTAQNPTHNYATYGSYNVALTINKAGVTNDTETKNAYVVITQDKPKNTGWTANVTSGTGHTPPNLRVQFTGTYTNGTPNIYDWNIGGLYSSTHQPVVTFTHDGVYWVNLTLSNAIGATSYNGTYTVLGSPPIISSAYFGDANSTYYPPVNIFFGSFYDAVNGGTPTSWSWNFGDGGMIGTTNNWTHPYTAPGIFTITLTMTNAWGSDTETLKYEVLTPPLQNVPILKWVDNTSATVTSAYVGVPVHFSFDTVTRGLNPPIGYLADYFVLMFYKKDVNTGFWTNDTTRTYYRTFYGGNYFTSADTTYQNTMQGVDRWVGYRDVTFTEAQTYRAQIVMHNWTNPSTYPPVTLGTADIVITDNPLLLSNIGGWTTGIGGIGLSLILAAIIIVILMAIPYMWLRQFNPYIEVFMVILGIGVSYYFGLISLWVIFGLGVIAAVVIFFMNRSGGGGGEVEGGEVG